MLCVLEIVKGPSAGEILTVNPEDKCEIGRSSRANLHVSDPHMSRRHFVVESDGTSFRICDNGSTNGTYVNRSRVKAAQLTSGDQIQAGYSVFVVHLLSSLADFSPQSQSFASIQEESAAPQRTLSFADNEVCEKVTRRWEMPRTQRSAVERSFEHPVEADNRVEVRDLEDERSSDAALSGSLLSAAFQESFESSQGIIRVQRSINSCKHDQILDKLHDWHGQLSLVVNLAQLSREQVKHIGTFSLAEVRRISQSLCVLDPYRKTDLIDFYKSCFGLDAAICLGSRERLTKKWLRGMADLFSYPSLLYRQACDSPQKVELVSVFVEFILCETPGETLCLIADSTSQEHEVELSH